MELDISKPFEEIVNNFSKSSKDDIRKIKNFDYRYELSSNSKLFEEFYQKIYYPFIIGRHGELTIPEATNYNEIKAMFEKGKLLIVKDKERIVSGIIALTTKNNAFFTYAGVETKDDYLTKAAGAALYYFFIEWSKNHDIKILKFGGVRPFLNDGLFNYKKKWGMTVKIYKNMFGIFGIKLLTPNSLAVNDFLEKNPFIYVDNNKLRAIIYTKENLNKDIIKQIWDSYFIMGLSNITIISNQEIEDEIKTFVTSEYGGKISFKENIKR
jgi:hypothetical protein